MILTTKDARKSGPVWDAFVKFCLERGRNASQEHGLWMVWQQFSKELEYYKQFESMVVMEFSEENEPIFEQGFKSHELLTPVTAERCRGLIDLLIKAERSRESMLKALQKAAQYDIRLCFGQDGDVKYVTAVSHKHKVNDLPMTAEIWYEAADMSRCKATSIDEAIVMALSACVRRCIVEIERTS